MLFRWLIRQDSTALPKELVMSYGATLPFLQAQILRFQSRNKKPVLKGWLKQGRKIAGFSQFQRETINLVKESEMHNLF